MDYFRESNHSFIYLHIEMVSSADPDTTYEEDMQILRVIEAYCAASSAKQRQTIAASSEFKHL